ncbi:MAG: hypothetical protein IPK32_19345 [Verrucomicrobiaceae bacterium]|nr:hypothetical protein [Verrucomicrobiaceae bacterium]
MLFFCTEAFSKPERAVPASAFISELFEGEEDRLAELARVPDLVIELGCGEAAISCIVASKWATRGETHRLARLAESILAAQGNMKNSAATEVMLALSATLAVTRPARAEQLFNAAFPNAGEEHAEALADAKRWIEAGRMTASMPQEVRDLWDTRARRPRVAWKWESADEVKALNAMAECLDADAPGAEVFQRVAPAAWWSLALQKGQVEAELRRRKEAVPPTTDAAASTTASASPAPEQSPAPPANYLNRGRPNYEDVYGVQPQASSMARIFLGWSFGVLMMAGTILLAPDGVYRLAKDFRGLFLGGGTPPLPAQDAVEKLTPEQARSWRENQAASMAAKHTDIAEQFITAKNGTWKDTQMLLSGHSDQLPYSHEKYSIFLTWLHLDPPQNAEMRQQTARLLLEREDSAVLNLWERLVYPGSPNAEDIRLVAREVLQSGSRSKWAESDLERLRLIAQEEPQKDRRTCRAGEGRARARPSGACEISPPNQAMIPFTTSPAMSVRRKSRPAKR